MQFDVYENLPIFVFNALAGAGKTYALAKHADELARTGKKILFVQPTIQLIDNTYSDEFLARWKPDYRIQPIHSGSDNFSRSVKSEILNRMRAEDAGGEILLITHEAVDFH
jgi:primosomal protein N'